MYFTEQRIGMIQELSEYRYQNREQITEYRMKEGSFSGGEVLELDTSDWDVFQLGDKWGGHNKHFWFRTEFAVTRQLAGKSLVYEVRTGSEGDWDALNPQFLIYLDGKLIQGLDVNHRSVILTEGANEGDVFKIALYAYSGMHQGKVDLDTSVAILNREVEKLYYDILVPANAVKLLDNRDKRKIDIVGVLNEAINLIDLRRVPSKEFDESVREAERFLDKELYKDFCGRENIIATCVGHTHIDVAWLWTLSQTREKVVRSFSTVLNLMKQYPEYIFMSSQPQLYKYIKEDMPELYASIKEKIREGRWEAEGAMWLEADCNLSSGESLVRQIMFGKRFFKEEFNVDSKILWLPDVFGYSAALPQILKKSGVDYFMTTKISWSEYNKMPYDTFLWSGIDGTEILTHFITTCKKELGNTPRQTSYNGIIEPKSIIGAWDRYQQKNINNEVLISFGYGDGGGGPTKEMLENARRMSKGIPGCPSVKMGKSLDFFKRIEEKVRNNSKLPKWIGELYLELHRGTYTSMARNKKYNRECEFLYQDAELMSVINTAVNDYAEYPQVLINEGWETILLNQFHDILPGSSIKEVYEDSQKQYAKAFKDGHELLNTAISGITENIDLKEDSVVVFNQLSFVRNDIVELDLPIGWKSAQIEDEYENILPSQIVESRSLGEEGCKKVLFYAENVPSKGYKAFKIKEGDTSNINERKFIINSDTIVNSFYEIKFDNDLNIKSIYDKKAKREVLKQGERGNVLQAFEDKPFNFDAWDVNIYYQEKMWEINDIECAEVVENGPVRATLKISRRFLDSSIIQFVHVYNDIPRIDFKNIIDWKEKQILLKAAFPVDIHNNKATYEIQYGNVERPTHWNTSWDYAKFEVCAHKWADLSEEGYGVSLLNDCKYGYDIKGKVMRLTLLKSGIYPNESADKETHEFTYSLFPHSEGWKSAGTVNMAYSLNCPMYAEIHHRHKGKLPNSFSLVSVDKGNVVIEVVKKAEDSEDIIIRLNENHNRRTKVKISFFMELTKVYECDLLENNLSKIEVFKNTFEVEINPYEIKTYKLILC